MRKAPDPVSRQRWEGIIARTARGRWETAGLMRGDRWPNFSGKKEEAVCYKQTASIYVGDDLLSHTLSRAVQSALRGLTSVFGMGTGISHAVKSPALLTWARLAPRRSVPGVLCTQDLRRRSWKEHSPSAPGLKPLRFGLAGRGVKTPLFHHARGRSLTTE